MVSTSCNMYEPRQLPEKQDMHKGAITGIHMSVAKMLSNWTCLALETQSIPGFNEAMDRKKEFRA